MTLHIKTAGSDIAHTDHSANVKGGGVCIYYKKFLPLRVLNIVFLNECINFDLRFGNKTCNFVIFYRSPIQFQDVFESFATILCNYVLHESIMCEDRDPPWFNSEQEKTMPASYIKILKPGLVLEIDPTFFKVFL